MEYDFSKVCVINFADGAYVKAQARLAQSIKFFHPEIQMLFLTELPSGCPAQNESPMAFKPHLFDEARKMGFEIVLWLDAVCVVVRPLMKIFKKININGVYLWTLYSSMGQWCADRALLGIDFSREDSFLVPELTTCVVGLDLRSEIGNDFLNRWKKMSDDGITFRGMPLDSRSWLDSRWNLNGCISSDTRVLGHRHDQTAASAIAEKLKVYRSCLFTFDVQQVIGNKENVTRNVHIPLDAIVLQNRDMKNGAVGMSFADHLELTNIARRKALFATIRRLIKHILFSLKIKRLWI